MMRSYISLATLAVAATLCALIDGGASQCFFGTDDLSKPVSTDLQSITDFGLTLFKELFPYKESRNFFFSPYSIWSAITLAYFGSKGNTESQLRDALGVSDKVDMLRKWRSLEFAYNMRQVNKSDYTFNLANRAYFDKAVRLNPCVESILSNELKVADLSQTNKVSAEINNWVSNTTHGRITELVKPEDLTNANMILANAVFFKGTWQTQFKKSNTKKQIFYSSPQDMALVDMMTQKGNFRNGMSEELGAHILELPYTGEDVSMLLLLPPFISGDQGFDAMVNRLNSTTLKNALDRSWTNEVELTMPKFKLEESVGNELIEALKRMGVADLFDKSLANLSDFSPYGQLSVDKSIHKAQVEVTEEGTEAAAATAFISLRSSIRVGPSKFVCNHPFLVIIYDNVFQNVLFMGAYKSPGKKQ